MSIFINNVIIHEFRKDEDENLLLQLRSDCIAVDSQSSHSLVSELHRAFNSKQGKGFGQFKSDSEFAGWLSEMRNAQLPFQEFSNQSAELLKNELSKYPFAEEGFLVIAEYQSLATDYLFVALLPNSSSLKITDDLSISATEYLDLAKADIVARVDLTTYETNKESNRYLSFIKGRVGRKVSDFFLDFLQAESGLDVKAQNQVLMQAVDDFCTDSRMDKNEANDYKKQIASYCTGQLKDGDEIQVRELSNELPELKSGNSFQDFVKGNGYELEDTFPVDRTAVRKLTKFVGAGGGVNISFDSSLLGEKIFYDPETDTLTLTPPPNLKDQLTRNRN
ncbi:nucleoid-associated protein YejK [Vibrio atlanticus]|uniref:nucleoid-associated protein YejK n=2 Tax=Vibrionaceae TaxID=641 RepID=UPI00354FFDDF